MNEKRRKKLFKIAIVALGATTLTCALSLCATIILAPGEELRPLPEEMVAATPSPTVTVSMEPTHTPIPTIGPEWVEAKVIEVIDGDTIKVIIEGQGIYTVRYIGIDTPETVHPSKPVEWMGKEASGTNTELVGGQTVYLEKDVSEVDRYDRLLRYVFLADGLFVNAELVRLGHAQVSTYPPDVRHVDLFLEMQQEAREAKRGLWNTISTPTLQPAQPTAQPTSAPEAPEESPVVRIGAWDCPESTEGATYVGSRNSNKYHKSTCRWAKKINSGNRICFADREAAEAAGYIPCKVCKP